MVISEGKNASCKKNGHKKKGCCVHGQPDEGQQRKPSGVPLSPMSPENTATPTAYRKTNRKREEISVDYLLSCPFKKVCDYLGDLDMRKDWDLISEAILHFSLRIYGLPECRQEDLPLAVYLFIEDTFGIQSRIELCVRLHEDWNLNVIGVVFETIHMKYNVLKNDALLEGAEVRMKDNKDVEWVLEAMISAY